MRFGLFNLLQKRDAAKPDSEIFHEMIEQTRLAESIGFDISWFGEHHFSSYSVCPSPLVAAAYCAGHTERIRLGTGVLVLPLYDPVRVLQEIAMVDAMSNGRLVVGVGTGYQPYEFQRFRASLDEKNEMFTECLDVIELGLTQPRFSYDGKYYQIPEMQIAVWPVQRPLPEMWVAGVLDDAIRRRVVRSGYIPFFAPTVRPITHLEGVRDDYHAILRERGLEPREQPLGLMRYMQVTDSRKEAEDMAERALYSSRMSYSMRAEVPEIDGIHVKSAPLPDEPSVDEVVDAIITGDPETCAERLAHDFEVMNPAHIAFYIQPGGMPHARVMRSLERFGAKVIPALEKAVGPLDQIGGRRARQAPSVGQAA